MLQVPLKPKSFPTNLLPKDWSKRKPFGRFDQRLADKVHDMVVRDDDVWLVTIPKCGTTWMQELLWLVLNNFDFEAARNEHLEVRSPFDYLLNGDLDRGLESVETLRPPRLIKSHDPLPLLPQQLWCKKPKTIYVYRNPKDYIVSLYYYKRSHGFGLEQTLEQHVLEYIGQEDKAVNYFEHVTEFYALRNEPWIFYTSFECMKQNLRKVIEDVCQFLNKNITEEQMEGMLHHLSFEEMKKNPKVNQHWGFEQLRAKYYAGNYVYTSFARRGLSGGYKDELSADVIAKVDGWIKNNLERYNLSINELLLLDAETAV
ncbi:sulfotransferase 1A3-like isoform X2 [Eurosta solidaginis]|uniref:sulfotransferase 1A3-like isoform X2 n=1 Tax=Eurosta solidaginis TaxID=178769 RepID=UPI003530CC43